MIPTLRPTRRLAQRSLRVSILLLGLLLLLTACFEGVIRTETRIEDASGRGRRVLDLRLYRDGAPSPDNSCDLVDGMAAFLPGGNRAVYDAIATARPVDWIELEWIAAEDEGRQDYDTIRIAMAFDSLEAYNARARQLAGQLPFTPATLEQQGQELIYREALANVRGQMEWFLRAVYGETGENPGVFSASQGGTADPISIDETFKHLELVVDLMGTRVAVHPPFDRPGQVLTVIAPLGELARPEGGDWRAAPDSATVGEGDFALPDAGLELRTRDDWTRLFERREGWLGADGIFSIPLDGRDQFGDATAESRTFFTFADTTIGHADDMFLQFRLGWRMVNQSAAILRGANEISFCNAIYDNTVEAGAPEPDGMLYVYGYRNRVSSDKLKQLVLARVPKARFSDRDAWSFYDGSAWHADIGALDRDEASLADHVSPEVSVTWVDEGPLAGRYLLVYQHDTISPHIVIRTAERLTGPFDEARQIYRIPEPELYAQLPEGEVVTYNAKAHPHLSARGTLLISYNVNLWGALPSDTQIYRPRFIELALDGRRAKPIPYDPAHTNLLPGRPIEASRGEETAARAIDGQIGPGFEDAWIAPSLAPVQLTVDLGDVHRIDRWSTSHASAVGLGTVMNTRRFALLASMNGKNWKLVDLVEDNRAARCERVVKKHNARYVRLVILEPSQSDEPVARIYEWEVFGRRLPNG